MSGVRYHHDRCGRGALHQNKKPWTRDRMKQLPSVCEHQTRTSHSIHWNKVRGHLPGVSGRPEKDKAGHLHQTPETIFEQKQGLPSPQIHLYPVMT